MENIADDIHSLDALLEACRRDHPSLTERETAAALAQMLEQIPIVFARTDDGALRRDADGELSMAALIVTYIERLKTMAGDAYPYFAVTR